MKMKIGILVNLFLIIDLLLMLTLSCKKDETIVKKDPVITWANPAEIIYGTLLSVTQLNATANLPGTFVYTPAIGTKLEVGASQSLNVVFTPTDIANYNSVDITIKINVIAVPTVSDINGNVYHTIKIGTQVWFVENLKVTKYNDGTTIPDVTDNVDWSKSTTGAYCDYGNNPSNYSTYGRLYNWYVVDNTASKISSNGGKNVCPTGWHVPSNVEWTSLTDFLTNSGYNWDGSTTENKVAKSMASRTGWTTFNVLGTVGNDQTNNNSSGFNAFPFGRRDSNGTFDILWYGGFWWSSKEYIPSQAFYRQVFYQQSAVKEYISNKTNGYSVRCLKD